MLDTRASQDSSVVRRRRACNACGRRYTTFERLEATPLRVIKKDGTRVPYDRERILKGMLKACEKRPVALPTIEDVVNRIDAEIRRQHDREVPSQAIGELVMRELRELDQVAYVRFASVYREFKDLNAFLSELQPMLDKKPRRSRAAKA